MDLSLRIHTKGAVSHEGLCPQTKADLSLSVIKLDTWAEEAENWRASSHFKYKTKSIQQQYFVTVITEQFKNILPLQNLEIKECIIATRDACKN